MGMITVGLLLIAGVWALAYHGASRLVWAITVASTLLLFQLAGLLGWAGLLLWPLAAVLTIPFFLHDLRKQHLTSKVFGIVRQVLPPMSSTEKEAIDAGDVWWEAKLFQGVPDWSNWLKTVRPQLSEHEQSFLDNEVETLLSKIDEWHLLQETKDMSPEVWDYLKANKFFGLIIPKSYGGREFSALANSAVVTKIATHSVSAAVTTMVPNSLGPAELLLKYGTQEQKDYYLPRLADGSEIPCFGLTSTVAGSDAGSIQDTGIVCNGTFKGKKVLGIKLNWEKRYITLAPVATVLGLAFKLYDPDGLLGDKKSLGITVCLVPTDTDGVVIGDRHMPLEQAFMNGPTTGKDVFIPIDWIIGGVEQVGKGWQMLMECLAEGRGISLPALATACTSTSYGMAGGYARLREQFNTPIGFFEGIQEKLAQIGGFAYMTEASRQLTTAALDLGQRPSIISAIAKYHMTEMSRQSVNNTMDIMGGKAIIMGPSNFMANLYMTQPISITVEGANILTRSLMIFGQGAIRCHPFVQEEMLAAGLHEKDAEQALSNFDKAFIGHVHYFVRNVARGLFRGLCGSWLVIPPHRDEMSRYFQKLSHLSSALAVAADVSMMFLGGKLKMKERLSARLGDVLSYLYLATATLKYYYEHGAKEIDRGHVEWALSYAIYQCQQALSGFFDNFPIRSVGIALRLILFPFGFHAKMPSDKLSGKVALAMMEETDLRNRLCHHIFLGNTQSGTYHIESAFRKYFEVSPSLAKVEQAIKDKSINRDLNITERLKAALDSGIISQDEHQEILAFEALRTKVITVDTFSADYFAGKSQWKNQTTPLKAERSS